MLCKNILNKSVMLLITDKNLFKSSFICWICEKNTKMIDKLHKK